MVSLVHVIDSTTPLFATETILGPCLGNTQSEQQAPTLILRSKSTALLYVLNVTARLPPESYVDQTALMALM